MIRPAAYFWKQAPFLRILPGLIAGIIIHWYLQPEFFIWILLLPVLLSALSLYSFLPAFKKFSGPAVPGIISLLIFSCLGGLLTWKQDIRNDKHWLGKKIGPESNILVTISSPLIEKEKSWRADATVKQVFDSSTATPVTGHIIIYFSKDSLPANITYGSRLIINKKLQAIKGPSNPGAFDYKKYCLFQGITHQVYVNKGEYEILPGYNKNRLRSFIFSTRENILDILRKYIPGDRESGLAEALLLGYRNDLDKSLVQTYSNTGVVHIIAVSGLHLGLIYMLLVGLLKPLRRKKTMWVSGLIIIAGLWLFSLLAGAQASILRSALMFSCIVIGESIGRKTSIYNSIAASAFILACINPFILWDVGFQLSYAAVLSIVIFMKPVYHWLYFSNPLVDMAWKLNAVTISAQILTLPLTFYYFHQFPTWFIFTNFVAVPLSSFILLAEILLCACSFFPSIAFFTGKIISWLISVMNNYVEWIEDMPLALLQPIIISIAEAWLLYFTIGGMTWWLVKKSVAGFKLMLISIFFFVTTNGYSLLHVKDQHLFIVYDIPGKTVIDFVSGNKYWSIGDGSALNSETIRKFHLEPSRLQYRIHPSSKFPGILIRDNFISYDHLRILFPGQPGKYADTDNKIKVDLVIISGKQKGSLADLAGGLGIRKVVIDSSVPAWTAEKWEKECRQSNIEFHRISEDGAFVMKLQKPTFALPSR